MTWGRFPIEDRVRIAAQQPKHSDLLRAIATVKTWRRESADPAQSLWP